MGELLHLARGAFVLRNEPEKLKAWAAPYRQLFPTLDSFDLRKWELLTAILIGMPDKHKPKGGASIGSKTMLHQRTLTSLRAALNLTNEAAGSSLAAVMPTQYAGMALAPSKLKTVILENCTMSHSSLNLTFISRFDESIFTQCDPHFTVLSPIALAWIYRSWTDC